MEYGKPFLLNIFTFNDLHEYLVENPIQTLIIRRHIVFLAWSLRELGLPVVELPVRAYQIRQHRTIKVI